MLPNSIGRISFVRSSKVDDDREEQRADNTWHLDKRSPRFLDERRGELRTKSFLIDFQTFESLEMDMEMLVIFLFKREKKFDGRLEETNEQRSMPGSFLLSSSFRSHERSRFDVRCPMDPFD